MGNTVAAISYPNVIAVVESHQSPYHVSVNLKCS